MANKSQKKAARINATLSGVIAQAAMAGYNVSGGYEDAVALLRRAGKADHVVKAFAAQYYAGYMARYLQARETAPRNIDAAARIVEAAAILDLPGKDTKEPNRRTALQHSAWNAAKASFSNAKRDAGLTASAPKKASRKARASKANETDATKKMMEASPTVKTAANANDYLAKQAAAMLAFCNKNAKIIAPQASSAVSDFSAAIKALLAK